MNANEPYDTAMNRFDERVMREEGAPLSALEIDTIQVNIGLRCNLHCVHCHLASGPKRTEQMSWDTMQRVIAAARRTHCRLIDITGGAPEMHPEFQSFVAALRDEGYIVQVRTNLTILLQPGYEHNASFMADRGVLLVASLPCYLEENVDAQRGHGVYRESVRALRMLNELGYGLRDDLPLNLVYNPLGPVLPPSQESLEADYRRQLDERFGIRFTRLLTFVNMPIGRFWANLRKRKTENDYMDTLRDAFNPRTIEGLMCRHLISVDWDGRIHDCDFNLALKLPVDHGTPNHIHDFDPELLGRRRIVTGEHCFGCTAGCGSSCGGALVGD